ncbi:MAG: nucleoside triphosphate pyrophosphohydrolase [Proteobacteria bacterium]|nr:nucleoside triphosphate pyrophosphohydrolase [Pseudomonadota bacterium]MDA0959969.1 nucleoside triphosphate pyrophosphohydrolase [Pseudomonadota bacterium]MDA1151650.1 nucleoside triphosphate pyrophosphohydrolase [Pseudomonadota bacterium]
MKKHLDELDRLHQIMIQLRDPNTGCPWDVAQDFTSIAPYTIEEAYEVADAIQHGERDAIRDELGDLLLQVIFHARIAEEEGSFTLADVAKSISDKMIVRHPHVFGGADRPTMESQNGLWEDIKARERAKRGETRLLDGIARGLPPMLRALKLQKRAARVGFDWPDIDQILQKMNEEAAELRAELARADRDQDRIKDEVGDLLFVAVNLARKAGIDPETALQTCNLKFERRFNYVEEQVELNQDSFENASLDLMERYWQDAKALERKSKDAEAGSAD